MTDDVPTVPADEPAVGLTACAVATVAELPAVRVLADSFTAHHPDTRLVVLLVDLVDAARTADIAPGRTADPEYLHPTALGIGDLELARLRTAYPPAELCAVLRPRLIRWLLGAASTSGPVLHLDPSVLVVGPVAEPVLAGLVDHPLVLVPRVLAALPEDGCRPDATELRAAGLFDPALIAANRGAEDFLASWAEHAIAAPTAAATFLDGAPVLLEHHVLRDPGVGLSVWNAGQRPLTDTDGELRAANVPLRTVHFAGFDPARPWLLSAEVTDRPRVLLSEHRPLARLCARYVSLLTEAADPGDPPAAGQRIGSARLPAALRARYRADWLTAERTAGLPPPPLTADPADFLDWACGPADDRPGSTRWSAALWESDVDLRRRFPDPFGAEAAGFREWCAGTGVPAGLLPHEAVPSVPVGQVRLTDQLGVSVLGAGPTAELVRAAAIASGLPMSDRPEYPVLVCCSGAAVPAGLTGSRYVIQVPDLPGEAARCAGADELWTLSEAGKSEVDGTVDMPVHAIGLPVRDPGERAGEARNAARVRLGWPAKPDTIVFGVRVDHAHETADNALAAVAAFLRAFPDRTDVALLLLARGAEDHPEAAERLRLAIAVDDRSHLVEGADEADWLDAVDCLLAPHRVEQDGADRIGLGLAEQLARGLPVIAGNFGVAGELLGGSEADAVLLVGRDAGGRGPDPDSLVRAMHAVAENPDALAEVGRLGRESVLGTHAVSAAGERLRQRVEHAYHTWRARRTVDRAGQPADPLRPLRSAKHVLLREPDVGVGHKIPMAPALRKAVLRVLNHYDAHLRSVLTTLVDGVERSVQEVARRQDELTAGPVLPDVLSERLDELTDQVDHAEAQLTAVDDGLVRARADLAGQARRVAELEDAVVGEAARRGKLVDALAERLDRLTAALDRTLDRIDVVESRLGQSVRDQDARTEAGLRAASHALRTSDALRRVVLREHERRAGDHPIVPVPEQPSSSLVLCDAGLLRLPSDDGVMLPLLSSNGVWEPELAALIDSMVEPGGVFLDIGSYVGYHTVRVLSRLGTSGTVVAVEPADHAVELLRHNVSVNVPGPVAERVVVVPAAAWDSPGTLRAEAAMTGGVWVRPVPAEPAGDQPDESASAAARIVPSVRLDKELEGMAGLHGARLSVVNVDTPGSAHRALGGLVRLLRRDRPQVFCAFSATRTSDIGDDPVTALREFGTWGYDIVLLGSQDAISPEDVLDATRDQHSTTLWLRPRAKNGPGGSENSP